MPTKLSTSYAEKVDEKVNFYNAGELLKRNLDLIKILSAEKQKIALEEEKEEIHIAVKEYVTEQKRLKEKYGYSVLDALDCAARSNSYGSSGNKLSFYIDPRREGELASKGGAMLEKDGLVEGNKFTTDSYRRDVYLWELTNRGMLVFTVWGKMRMQELSEMLTSKSYTAEQRYELEKEMKAWSRFISNE